MGLLLVPDLPGDKAEQGAQEFRARRVEPGSFLPTFLTELSLEILCIFVELVT